MLLASTITLVIAISALLEMVQSVQTSTSVLQDYTVAMPMLCASILQDRLLVNASRVSQRDQALRDQTPRDQTPRDQTLKNQTLRDQAVVQTSMSVRKNQTTVIPMRHASTLKDRSLVNVMTDSLEMVKVVQILTSVLQNQIIAMTMLRVSTLKDRLLVNVMTVSQEMVQVVQTLKSVRKDQSTVIQMQHASTLRGLSLVNVTKMTLDVLVSFSYKVKDGIYLWFTALSCLLFLPVQTTLLTILNYRILMQYRIYGSLLRTVRTVASDSLLCGNCANKHNEAKNFGSSIKPHRRHQTTSIYMISCLV